MTAEATPVLDEMPKLTPNVVGDTIFFERAQCAELGTSLHDQYVSNDPFPHIVVDEFLPRDLLHRVLAEFPDRMSPRFSDAQSKLKTGYQMEKIESPLITNLLNALNSSQFLGFLEEMTGIKGLIPDPHFAGGGLHETARGGHLSIHADFNMQRRLNLRRRMNLILFLNEDWQDSYGGHLELWSTDMKECRHKVSPVIGRMVVFNTEEDSYHGHPDPTTSPEQIFRRSIALYYYTAVDPTIAVQARTTQFKPRPGSADKRPPVSIRLKELAWDLTPPILARRLFRDH
ncbi:MAG: 2OG-Fe(II) oxygenase [Pseudomonadota bacterium]